MARYAAVMIVNAWDPFVQRQYERAAARVHAGRLFVAVDETAGPVPVPPHLPVLAVSEATVTRLRLPVRFERTLFCYNVDYFYYAFFLEHPDYDTFVFFDTPAVIDLDLDAMVDVVARDRVDFVAQPVSGTVGDWTYAERHRDLYPPGVLRGASLPLAILSKAAIAFLLQRRLQLARAAAAGESFTWPFCEAFVPSELARGGFRSAPLSDYGSVASYAWWPPVLEASLPAERRPGFLHPVLDRPRYVRFMLEHARARDLLGLRFHREILRHVPGHEAVGPILAEAGHRLRRAARARLGLGRRKDGGSTAIAGSLQPPPARRGDKTVPGI